VALAGFSDTSGGASSDAPLDVWVSFNGTHFIPCDFDRNVRGMLPSNVVEALRDHPRFERYTPLQECDPLYARVYVVKGDKLRCAPSDLKDDDLVPVYTTIGDAIAERGGSGNRLFIVVRIPAPTGERMLV